MSLEDHNLATIMEDRKNLKQAIADEHYIDYVLHQQGMGQQDADDIRDREVERMTRDHARRDSAHTTTQCRTLWA
eukprot:295466-Amphidinium_carterae.1